MHQAFESSCAKVLGTTEYLLPHCGWGRRGSRRSPGRWSCIILPRPILLGLLSIFCPGSVVRHYCTLSQLLRSDGLPPLKRKPPSTVPGFGPASDGLMAPAVF